MPETALARYYQALDDRRIDAALELLDPDIEFTMVLPAGVRRGRGREDMRAYLGARGPVERAHVLLRQARDADVEFCYGRVTDDGVTTGRFLSGARVGADGLIVSYEVTFDTEHVLVDA
jgi:ketosteroid isomerase-like protein